MTQSPVIPRRKMKEALSFEYTCQKCKKRDKSVYQKTLYTKNYQGPCGDSFCYASCTMSACRPITATVCDKCEKELRKEP